MTLCISSVPENEPGDAWPEHGEVRFDNYKTSYREELEPVLRGIDCHILRYTYIQYTYIYNCIFFVRLSVCKDGIECQSQIYILYFFCQSSIRSAMRPSLLYNS